MLFRSNHAHAKEESLPLVTSTLASATSRGPVNPIELAQKNWKDAWYPIFNWIDWIQRLAK